MLKNLLMLRREELGLSIRQASAKIGISHTYLASLERGTDTRGLPANTPTPDVLRLISAGYNIPYHKLMESCSYLTQSEAANSSADSSDAESSNEAADSMNLRIIARACRRMTPTQVLEMKRYARAMFPEAFEDEAQD